MKTKIFSFLLLFMLTQVSINLYANEPKSAYIFAYATGQNNNHNGLHFAWSIDQKTWFPIGPEFSFVKSDYSRWGSEKRMLSPVLFQDKNANWHAVWTLNERDGAFAYAFSEDLVNWKPQAYPLVAEGKNCMQTELSFNNGLYTVSWASINGTDTTYSAVTTPDFKTYSKAKQISKSDRIGQRKTVLVANKPETGTVHPVSWDVIDKLEKKVVWTNYRNQLFSETMKDDHARFADLKPLEATISIDVTDCKKISDKLLGIFFEDINYSADGGIYAELIQNRDFEYSSADRREWNSKSFWNLNGDNMNFEIGTENPIHENNSHYAVLTVEKVGAGIRNEGFDGIVLKEKEKYNFSLFARSLDGKKGKLIIRLIDHNGKILGETNISGLSKDWKKYEAVITAKENATNARLEIAPQTEGKIALDMVSLFPQKTFKNRKNGLRADLAQTLADLKPQFVRFPGGCVAHGDGIGNIYHWKNTVGALEARKPQRNIWGYHQTAGLGYFEYFQFCEDIAAEPIPIVAAGVPCQNSAHHGCAIGGQQGGIPLSEMDAYVQDIVDLVEWANGDPKKSKWAKMRADAGHPKPFNLKYIGVGNEDLISEVFEERFEMIFKALKEKHPEITVIGTAGPFCEGSDYERGWELASELGIPMLDEHYYQPPGWYIYNQDYYDRYDRNKAKVYLGEYASHLPGRPNNIETALTEALHLISCERNGDVVEMTSYAPLLAKEKFTQWNPDLIYFNNSEVKPTVGYYVQQLFGQNAGTEYISSAVSVANGNNKVQKRVACSVVRDSSTGNTIVKIVNLLPVEVKAKLNADELGTMGSEVERTILKGKPDDRGAHPLSDKVLLEDIDNLELPAYSFTVLRFK
ncbi:alpha-L-arabinofuranosidase [Dysgonomonas sp. 216]|uniref:alpha-L-arabinofuranosidase C-terminal domain-containing protein n=1 Tax=Dysgonomonas sp. 216 TaxID=2302934 RepID=UPI0013D6CBF4|nr:alpha-L-arabinofuranosidase C-terminal domain-containing protein [Dysgonomonas sp. 216]NDW19688.1 alpha-L-arabinofuranosidase [Dysgonomonas sp. 216]